jgi:hypothetical protein
MVEVREEEVCLAEVVDNVGPVVCIAFLVEAIVASLQRINYEIE